MQQGASSNRSKQQWQAALASSEIQVEAAVAAACLHRIADTTLGPRLLHAAAVPSVAGVALLSGRLSLLCVLERSGACGHVCTSACVDMSEATSPPMSTQVQICKQAVRHACARRKAHRQTHSRLFVSRVVPRASRVLAVGRAPRTWRPIHASAFWPGSGVPRRF